MLINIIQQIVKVRLYESQRILRTKLYAPI